MLLEEKGKSENIWKFECSKGVDGVRKNHKNKSQEVMSKENING